MSVACEDCPWPQRVVEPTELKKNALIAFVGEGPAEDEWARKQYFVGAAGREHERTLARAGVARSECATLNAHRCVRPKGDDSAARMNQAVRACRPRLLADLEAVAPKSMILLGGSALRAIAPGFVRGAASDGLMRHRGSLWSRQEVEAANQVVMEWGEPFISIPLSVRYVMATIHPSAIIQRKRIAAQPSMAFRMVPAMDIKRLIEALARGRKLAVAERKFGPPAWRGEPFVFDIETVSKVDRRPEWVGVQHASEEGSAVYGGPWRMMRDWIAREMSGSALKVGHNILGFDFHVIEADGISVREPFHDTMIAAGTCEGDMPRGLWYWASYIAGHRAMFHKELSPSGAQGDPYRLRRTQALRAAWRATGTCEDVMETEGDWGAFYNSRDCVTTGIVFRAQEARMRMEGWI